MQRLAYQIAVVGIFFAVLASGANFSLTVKHDSRRVIDLGVFGYAAGGKMVFEFKDFFLHDMDEYATANEKIGFTLDKVVSASFARQERNYAIKATKKDLGEEQENPCFVDVAAVEPSSRFMIPLQESLNQAVSKYEKNAADSTETTVDKKSQEKQLRGFISGLSTTVTIPTGADGLYALFFYNCKKMNKNKDPAHVSFTVKVSQFNVDAGALDSADGRNYLSVGEYPLPYVYMVFLMVFAGGLVYWHRILFSSAPEVRRNVRAIHQLMYALVILKLLTLMTHIIVLRQRRATGVMSGGWDYMFYFFQTIKGIALFTVIVLLGTGWSILKPFLSDRDRKLLLVVLPLQILANIALAVIEEESEGSKGWSHWRDALRLFDVGCCCAVLLPIVWSIRSLKDGTSASKAAQRNLSRLKQFRTFYIAAVVFIYFTRIVIEFVAEYLPYNYTWVGPTLYEVAAVLFYGFVAHQFQPSAESVIRSVGALEDDEASPDDAASAIVSVSSMTTSKMHADDVEDVDLQDLSGDATTAGADDTTAAGKKGSDEGSTKQRLLHSVAKSQ